MVVSPLDNDSIAHLCANVKRFFGIFGLIFFGKIAVSLYFIKSYKTKLGWFAL
jgi:hypothetical protein